MGDEQRATAAQAAGALAPADLELAAIAASLGELELGQGNQRRAEELLRAALGQRQAAAADGCCADEGWDIRGEAAEAAGDDDDWESGWDEGRLPTPLPVVPTGLKATQAVTGTSRPASAAADWEAASAGRRPPSTRSSLPGSGGGSGDAEEVPFGGGHVLEVHGLATTDTTTHLEAFTEQISGHCSVPPAVRWVDESHALVVYSDPVAARQALRTAASLGPAAKYPIRAFLDASKATREQPASKLQPPKPRQQTTTAVARRLIGAGLGINLRDKTEEAALRGVRQQRRQEEQRRQQALDAAWDD